VEQLARETDIIDAGQQLVELLPARTVRTLDLAVQLRRPGFDAGS